MSFQGHLVCQTCKLKLTLGKLIRDDDGKQVGFGHAKFTDDELGRVTLAFLAVHIKHELVAMGDDALYVLEELPEFDSLVIAPPGSPFALSHTPIVYAGVALWRLPCEPMVDREKRIQDTQRDAT